MARMLHVTLVPRIWASMSAKRRRSHSDRMFCPLRLQEGTVETDAGEAECYQEEILEGESGFVSQMISVRSIVFCHQGLIVNIAAPKISRASQDIQRVLLSR